ncbi:MAG: NUDIX hydrolase [Lachnospiraceae bacterium]|nr:NUDIX hydrolase [Lachnospiraceae bacterium]
MELWDLYDRDLNPLHKTWERRKDKNQGIPDGEYHIVCDLLIRHADGDFLLTRRDLNKEIAPGLWEASAGGSALAGETPEEAACREMLEETGLKAEKLEFVDNFVAEWSNSIFFSYVAYVSCDKDSVKLQEGETIEYKWVDLEGFFKFLDEDDALKGHNERYKKYIDTLR